MPDRPRRPGPGRPALAPWAGCAPPSSRCCPGRRDPDDRIGRLIRDRFGDEVHERLVDALIGSIYAADTDRFSLAAVPQLAALASSRSLLLGARRARAAAPPTAGPMFLRRADGHGRAGRRGRRARAEATGVVIRTRSTVTELARDGTGWRVDGEPADDVVLATPAASTAPLLRGRRRRRRRGCWR